MNSALFEALQVERVVMFVVLSIIILVAAFNILSSLIMLVRAKHRDIAILRTMGAPRRGLMKVFMTVGLTIGVLGIVAGMVLGAVGLYFRQPVVELLPAADRPESLGSVRPLPDRAAGEDRSGRGRRDHADGAGAELPRHPLSRPGGRRRPIRCRCFAMNEVLEVAGLKRSFEQAGVTHRRASRRRPRRSRNGEIVALLGPSGSGKSTLLQAVGLLEGGFEGSIRIKGEEAAKLDDAERTASPPRHARLRLPVPPSAARFQRARECGHPAARSAAPPAPRRRSAPTSLLGALGLAERADPSPQQAFRRRAAARRRRPRAGQPPALVLADEPTGNLDEATADIVFAEFLSLVRGEGSAALVATHNERIAAKMDRVLRLHDGVLE